MKMVFNPDPGSLTPSENMIILYDHQEIIDALENNRTVIFTRNFINSDGVLEKDRLFCLGFSELDEKFELYSQFVDFAYNNEMCNYFISL